MCSDIDDDDDDADVDLDFRRHMLAPPLKVKVITHKMLEVLTARQNTASKAGARPRAVNSSKAKGPSLVNTNTASTARARPRAVNSSKAKGPGRDTRRARPRASHQPAKPMAAKSTHMWPRF